MSSSKRAGKRPNSPDDAGPSKKIVNECMFGLKCYRKNPTHFEEFSHQHLTDVLPKWKNDNSLPDDIDPMLKRVPSIVLEQLKIVRSIANSQSYLRTQPHLNLPNSKDGQSSARSSKSSVMPSKPHKEETGSAKMVQMMRETTKHHGDVKAKLDAAAPYYFFLTSVSDAPQTHDNPLSITFTELLDKGLGDLECSLQINFMVDLGWLLAQYFYTGNRFKPLTLLFGVENEDLKEIQKLPKNITAVHVKPPNAFGHHHTKMSILAYTDKSIRVVVSTANLIESDWENRTQGLWVSPKLPQLSLDADTTAGDSNTLFRADLIRYLTFYRLPQLQEWIDRVRHADFSSVQVFFVASVPGTHYGPESRYWGHLRLQSLLRSSVITPKIPQCPWSSWPVIGQFSSIGSLGGDENSWLCSELLASMGAPCAGLDVPKWKLIYPSLNDVKKSLDGLLGGACLPYQMKVHQKQQWLTKYLHRWRSDSRFRSGAVPHIKSYARVSPGYDLLSWFLLTSANLSKAAWGTETKAKLPGRGLRILSYEAGVLFLPQHIVDDFAFNLEGTNRTNRSSVQQHGSSGSRNDYPYFPLHYDLPLHAYKSEDTPWLYDIFSDS